MVGNGWCFDIEEMKAQDTTVHSAAVDIACCKEVTWCSAKQMSTIVWCAAVIVSFATFPQKYLIHCPLEFKAVLHIPKIAGHMLLSAGFIASTHVVLSALGNRTQWSS